MAEQPLNKSTKKNKPAAQSKIQVGNIDIDESVGGHLEELIAQL